MIALCSATKRALIGMEINGKRATRELDEKIKHSENILPEIDKLLCDMECTLKDNDSYSVVIGPGSFTGIRVGAALIKGFAAGEERDVTVLSTLEFMAYSYIKTNAPNCHFCTIINALSGFFFYAEFDQHGKKIGEEKLITKDELEKIGLIKVSLAEENLSEDEVSLTAQNLLDFSLLKRKEGANVKANKVSPVYLRKSQAEANLEDKKS